MGLTQGLFAKLVADTSPSELRGTAFGLFNLISGGALLVASIIAGALWSSYGASATFWTGGGFAAITLLGLLMYRSSARFTRKKASA
jgi:MFS family permease